MSSPLLALLAQVAEPDGMTANQLFLLEVLKLVIPVVTGALSIAAAYLAYLKSREVKHEVGVLAKNVDGQMTRLIEQTERAARAEGQLEQATAAPPAVPPVVVQVDPDAIPGGRRKLDPPAPASPPPESDPSTHQP